MNIRQLDLRRCASTHCRCSKMGLIRDTLSYNIGVLTVNVFWIWNEWIVPIIFWFYGKMNVHLIQS